MMALTEKLRLLKPRAVSALDFVRLSSSAKSQEELPNKKEDSQSRPFDEIPGPKSQPVLGSLLEFIREGGIHNLHSISTQRFERYGPMFKDTILGKTSVHLSEPAEAEKLFRADGKYPNRPELAPIAFLRQQQGIHLGLSQLQGKEWQRVRLALGPKMLRPKSVQENMDNFNGVTSDLVQRFKTFRAANKLERITCDVTQHLFEWSTESIGTYVFDTRIGLFDSPPAEEAKRFINSIDQFLIILLPKLANGPPFYKLFKTPTYKEFAEYHGLFVGIVQKIIDRKLKELNINLEARDIENTSGASVLTYLLSKKDFSAEEIYMSATEMFGGGVDTTAYTTLWLLYCLAKNPDVQERLFQELDPLLNRDGFLSGDDLSRIPYLKACLKESQRLYPIGHIFNRLTQNDLVLCGYHIPAGAEIFYHNYAAGRSHKNFEEANKFKPERWLRDEGEKIHPFAMLPFGYGARMCIGRRVAEIEIYSLVSKLIKTFKITHDEEDVQPTVKFILTPDRPVKLTFDDR